MSVILYSTIQWNNLLLLRITNKTFPYDKNNSKIREIFAFKIILLTTECYWIDQKLYQWLHIAKKKDRRAKTTQSHM